MFKQLLLSNIDIVNTNKDYRRLIMINVVLIIASSIFIGFTFVNYFVGNSLHMFLDAIFAIPTVYGYFELRRKKNIDRASTFAIMLLFFTMLIVLFMLQAKDYTLLWSFLFAFIAMMLKGHKGGLKYIIIFYTIVYIAAYTWVGENILISEYIRFIAISLVVIVIAYFYEKSVHDAFDTLYITNNKLQDLNKNLEKSIQSGIEELRVKDEIVIKTAKSAAMGEMIGAISHQWKQPLNVLGLLIQDTLDAKKYNELDEKYLKEFIDDSMLQLHYMSKTIDDFKNFLKPDKDKETFYLHDATKDVLNILDKQLSENGIKINFSYEKIQIINHKGELEQVILCLINNAKDELQKIKTRNSDFTPEIDVDIKCDNNKNIITVSDNGGGISKENITKIFNSYFTTKIDNDGSGLGLYISKMIVENSLKGEILVKNGSKNGAIFKIILTKS